MALSDIVLAYIRGGAYDVLGPYAKGQWSLAEAISYLQNKFPSLVQISAADATEVIRQYDISRTTARQMNTFISDMAPPDILHGCMPGLSSEFAYAVVTQYRLPGEDRDRSIRNVVNFSQPASRSQIFEALPKQIIEDSLQGSFGQDVIIPNIVAQDITGAFRRC